MVQPVEKALYTFADYLTWDENERYEIIYGDAVMMAPPKRVHQLVAGEIYSQIHLFLKDKPCEVYFSPFGVRLFEQDGDTPDDVDTVVEPDISVVCDSAKLDDDGCKGAPDMVIEILSPSTMRHDRLVKFELYRRAGVREYWIVDPQYQSVEVFLRDENNDLRPREVYTRSDTAKVTVLDGCTVELTKVFPETK